jgi:lactate dehydrogenase-like 2-hydroxyacid dehydrogenase
MAKIVLMALKTQLVKTPLKIVFLDAATVGNVDNLSLIKMLGEYISYDYTLPADRIKRIADNSIVITNKVVIDREVMDRCPDLRLVCIAATGMNNVDLEYAALKGIQVKNVAGYSTESVTQSTFSMLFHLLHGNSYYDTYVKSGEYAKSPIFTHHGQTFRELRNKQYGIIGMGAIGKRVAEIACVFGAKVVYYSTSGKNMDTGFIHLPLVELFRSSDVISIHCALNDKTQNLLDEPQLRLMKPSVYLLNMSRGGIVNEPALAKAIDEDRIAGAALDVLTSEPVNADNPLLHIRNKHKLFITPHIAWASQEARRRLIEKIAGNIHEFLQR